MTLAAGLNYAKQILGTRYGWWLTGPVPAGAPNWAENGDPPDPPDVLNSSCNCAGLTNLMLRAAGQMIPNTTAGPDWDGGVLAYQQYYWNYSERFSIAKAVGEKYLHGTLIGRNYRDEFDQGHVAVLYWWDEDRTYYVLQSYDDGGGWPGVNWDVTIQHSHAGWYYEWAVSPGNWINF